MSVAVHMEKAWKDNEASAAALVDKREKLLTLYGDALIRALIVADSLQTVAVGLQTAITRLNEIDGSMMEHLN